MDSTPIYFQFNDKKAAYQALDTLLELGYEVRFMEHQHPDHKPTLQVFVEKSDLTSALEIAQAHGGVVLETYDSDGESSVYTSAYGLEDGLSIPAHVVNEDFSQAYLDGEASQSAFNGADQEDELGSPSGDGYDHFPAGVRL